MSRSDDLRVQDILDAAGQIAAVIKDGREAWDQDWIRQLAVERLLEIIGEAANALSDEFRAGCPDVPWKDVIGLRLSWLITTTAWIGIRFGSSPTARFLPWQSNSAVTEPARSLGGTRPEAAEHVVPYRGGWGRV